MQIKMNISNVYGGCTVCFVYIFVCIFVSEINYKPLKLTK